jgi:serine/threonine protein kinase
MESDTQTDLLRAAILRQGIASEAELRSWSFKNSHELLAELVGLRRLTLERARMLSLEVQNSAARSIDDQETLRLHKSEAAWQFPVEGTKSEGDEPTRRASARPVKAPTEACELARIGPYEIVKELGKGGASVVYEARLSANAPSIALKVLTQQALWGEADKRLRRESELLRRLRHPNIVRVFDEKFGDEPQYIAMELLDTSLEIELRNKGPLPIYRVLTIARVLCDALQHAHSRGVLHRDLKPANILLTGRGEPVIADFGLAKEVGPAAEGTGVSIQGGVLGTPAYMSPEQANGEDATLRSDVYSLGAVIYAMLAGRAPYQGSRPEQVLAQIFTWDPPQLSELRKGLPTGLDTVIHRALARDPEQRFESAEALRRALEAWDPRGPQISNASPSAPAQKLPSSSRLTILICLGVGLAIAVLLWRCYQISTRAETIERQFSAQLSEISKQRGRIDEQDAKLLELTVSGLTESSRKLGPASLDLIPVVLAKAEQQRDTVQLIEVLRARLDPWSRFGDIATWPELVQSPQGLFARDADFQARVEFAKAARLEFLGERELAKASLDACLKAKPWKRAEVLLLQLSLFDLKPSADHRAELAALQAEFDELSTRSPTDLPESVRGPIQIVLTERRALLAKQPELALELGQRAFYERIALTRKSPIKAWLSLASSLDCFRMISLDGRPELTRRACDATLTLTRAEIDLNPAALAPRFAHIRALQNRALVYKSQDARSAALEDLQQANAELELIRRSAPDPLAYNILSLDLTLLRAELGDSQVNPSAIESRRQSLMARWPQSANPRPLATREDLRVLLQTSLGCASLPWP